jgi:16S rRNA U516 pseudouridylate synthase RsuA-like enzyme
MEERLQKILARAGYGSRRANEELIQAGRVKVNGVKATLGMKADISRDTIMVDTNQFRKQSLNASTLPYINRAACCRMWIQMTTG